MKEHKGLGKHIICIQGTLGGCTVVLVVIVAVLLEIGTMVDTAASFICNLFFPYSSCSVCTTYDWGIPALDLQTPVTQKYGWHYVG